MTYSALVQAVAGGRLRRVLVVRVRDEVEARRLIYEWDIGLVVRSIGPVVGLRVLCGDWEDAGEQKPNGGDNRDG